MQVLNYTKFLSTHISPEKQPVALPDSHGALPLILSLPGIYVRLYQTIPGMVFILGSNKEQQAIFPIFNEVSSLSFVTGNAHPDKAIQTVQINDSSSYIGFDHLSETKIVLMHKRYADSIGFRLGILGTGQPHRVTIEAYNAGLQQYEPRQIYGPQRSHNRAADLEPGIQYRLTIEDIETVFAIPNVTQIFNACRKLT